MHEKCCDNVSHLFIPVTMFKRLRFKSFLFGVHPLLDKIFRVLQRPTHRSTLAANG